MAARHRQIMWVLLFLAAFLLGVSLVRIANERQVDEKIREAQREENMRVLR